MTRLDATAQADRTAPSTRSNGAPAHDPGWWATKWNNPLTSYYILVGATTMLLVLGLVMVLSSSSIEALTGGESVYSVFLTQGMYVIVGLVPMLLVTRIPIKFYLKAAGIVLIAAFLLQGLIFTPLARGQGGNTNWVHIAGGVTVQPSEFIKLALAVWLGVIMYRKEKLLDHWLHAVIPAVPVIGFAAGLVIAGQDLGTAIILLMLSAGGLFVAGIPMRIFSVAAAGIVAFAIVFVLSAPNRIQRFQAWLGHADVADPQGTSYQTKHGLWGLGSGGFTGVGLGAGRQKWSYLPEAHNDFIFAVIGEELGLMGTLVVLGLFAALGVGMVRVIRRHEHTMARVTTAAIACWIIGQALVNIGVVIGLLPVIGVPLPLVSAGGSALIASMVALGIVMHFARTEPGAAELLAKRGSVVKRSVAVVGRVSRGARRGARGER